MLKFVQNWLENKIPESVRVWAGIIFIILLPGFLIYFFAHYEGVASIIFLLIGLALAKKSIRDWIIENYKHALIFGSIFVIFGALFDGAGNVIYNLPVKALCPTETALVREVQFVEGQYHDDSDAYVQIFSCFSYRETGS